MKQSEQLKVIALLATTGLGFGVAFGEYADYPELLQELSDLTDSLDDTAIVLDEVMNNNREEVLQIVINYIKGVTT